MEITGVSRWHPHVGRDIGGVNLKIASHGALAKMGPFFGQEKRCETGRKTTRNREKIIHEQQKHRYFPREVIPWRR